MAKGGGEKSYFVGHITHNKEQRNIGDKANGGLVLNITQTNDAEDSRQDKDMSPSQESRKVRFMDVLDENEEDHGGGESNVTSKMSKRESPSKHIDTTVRNNSKNSSPSKLSRGSVNSSPFKQSKHTYQVTPTTLEGDNSRNSSNPASVSLRNDSRGTAMSSDSSYKFHANSNDTPDPELLVFPEKASSKNSNRNYSTTPGSQRSDNFRFHANGREEDNENRKKNHKNLSNNSSR